MSIRTFTGISPSFEAWAIRHKPTGGYLPMHWSGPYVYTMDEPGLVFPRLFRCENSAKRALSAWLRGEWQQRLSWDGDRLPRPVKPRPDRRREDMEVVRFRLVEGERDA